MAFDASEKLDKILESLDKMNGKLSSVRDTCASLHNKVTWMENELSKAYQQPTQQPMHTPQMMQQPQPIPQSSSKLKKVITLKDLSTMQDITNDLLQSGRQEAKSPRSARSTMPATMASVPPQQDHIVAQLAAQVAAAATESPELGTSHNASGGVDTSVPPPLLPSIPHGLAHRPNMQVATSSSPVLSKTMQVPPSYSERADVLFHHEIQSNPVEIKEKQNEPDIQKIEKLFDAATDDSSLLFATKSLDILTSEVQSSIRNPRPTVTCTKNELNVLDEKVLQPQMVMDEDDLNSNKRKVFERSFLMQFRFHNTSMEKPSGLPVIEDIIMDMPLPKSNISKSLPSLGDGCRDRGGSDFTPNYMMGGGGHRGGRKTSRDNRGRGQQRQGYGAYGHTVSQSGPKVISGLRKSENALKPSKIESKPQGTNATEEEQSEQRGGRMGSRGRGGHSGGDEGWTKVTSQKPIRYDPQKMKLSKTQFDESTVTLGPSRGKLGWKTWSGTTSKPSKAPPNPIPDAKPVDEEALLKKFGSIITEYLHLVDLKEATECYTAVDVPPSQGHLFVKSILEASLEEKVSDRTNVAQLLCNFVNNGMISADQYLKGVVSNMELAIDLELDLPKVWTCVAEQVAPIFYSCISKVPLSSLTVLAEPLLEEDKASIVVAEILKLLIKKMSIDAVVQCWKDSNLRMEYFLKSGDCSVVMDFLKHHGLEAFQGTSKPGFNFESCQSGVTKQLDLKRTNDNIFDWVEANFDAEKRSQPTFVRALTSAVCQKAIIMQGNAQMEVDKNLLKFRSILLKKFIDTDAKELQAVFALQKLWVDLEQPPNILKLLFDALYDEDVISEQTFFKWEKLDDPSESESEGKGVALLSVNPFFTWLRQAEVESDE